MHSSFNLIKSYSANVNGGKEIVTDFTREGSEESDNGILNSYEVIGKRIIDKARKDAEIMTMDAIKKIRDMEKESYEKAYQQGISNGYEDGYEKGYSEAKAKGEEEAAELINQANFILAKAEKDYDDYLNIKKEEIIKLSLEMAKMIAQKEFELNESILSLVEPKLEECKGEENIVIKCNGKYVDILKEKSELWKKLYAISGEIFILEDPTLELGNAIIEKNKGKIVVGIDISLNRIEESLKEICGEEKND